MNHDVAGIRGKTPVEESSQAFTEETPATQAGATAASATTGPAGGSKLGTAAHDGSMRSLTAGTASATDPAVQSNAAAAGGQAGEMS